TEFSASARFALPTPWVRPFVRAGLGIATWDVHDAGTNGARGTANVAPLGAGLQVHVTSCAALVTEGTYHVLFNRVNGGALGDDWGNYWSVTSGLRFAL